METCGECGAELDPTARRSPEDRPPCPRCGGTRRNFILNVEPGRLTITGGDVRLTASGLVGPGVTQLVVQAILTLGPKVPDGHQIIAVAPVWNQIARLIAADPNALYQIPPEKMEQMIAGWYAAQGFEVTLTPRSGDYGRDVIAEKPGILSVRIIDQVKAFKPGHLVDANDVRALLGVLHADQKANKGLVTTTSGFAPKIATDPSIAPFMPTRLELVDGPELIRRLDSASQGK